MLSFCQTNSGPKLSGPKADKECAVKKHVFAVVLMFFAMFIFAVYMNHRAHASESPKEVVVQVIGRATVPFDGLGAEIGFLVTDGQKFMIVHYDEGSMAAKGWEPKYLTLMTFSNGETSVAPLLVEPF